MAQHLLQKGLPRTPKDNRMAVSLLVFLVVVLIASVVFGIAHIGA
jgi:hypothetical protein